ncbi:MAG: sialate O-acetylesterase [Candidatus Pseudobacter hemicellulosilyticus]|uniref:Sialate O-acetylesterase n=1 Tax=Candidatus Pseudobacter hemicellulosilyticus TaxID=3121375 RepID=A0AAJ5WW51_9BACT|nr:MAG: sialate O-acetylesterase [Pseudobacter sp.]
MKQLLLPSVSRPLSLLGGLLLLVLSAAAQQNVQLPYFFSNDMVLQRQQPIRFWGTAPAKTTFSISFAGKKQTVKADNKGQWQVSFPAMEAGGPYSLSVQSDSSFTLSNILVGDVYLCSGQSNMEWSMIKTFNSAYELAQANYEGIRFFTTPRIPSSIPQSNTLPANWKTCTSENAWEFSAVAYYFARDLFERYKIPIGIIHSSWGGTASEAWTSLPALQAHPDFQQKVNSLLEANRQDSTLDKRYQRYLAAQEKLRQEMLLADPGLVNNWAAPAYNDADWKTMQAPGYLPPADSSFRGIVWARKKIFLPASMASRDLRLTLELLMERNTTYINGQEVGMVNWGGRCIYRVPATCLKEGENTIAIRFETSKLTAGFNALAAENLFLTELASSPTPLTVPLAGDWKYKPSLPRPQVPLLAGSWPNFAGIPASLYNGMIAPFTPLALKGFCWYQGEANSERAYQYRSIFPLLIRDWRAQWKQPDLPFFFVQLTGFTGITNQPVEHPWAELREAQTMTLSTPRTGMAVIIDVGNPSDVHPTRKAIVGKRLAAEAAKLLYGDSSAQTSPLYKTHSIKGDSIRLQFSNALHGLVARGSGGPKGLAIAGADHHFVWASARVDGNELVVWSPEVKQPVAVRYAWTGSPVESNGANLYNTDGFPVSPFRTDNWPGITVNKK